MKKAFTLAELAEHVGGSLEGSGDVAIHGLAGVDEAGPGELTFLANEKYRSRLAGTRASAVILGPGAEAPGHVAVVRAEDPYAAFALVLALFDPGPGELAEGIHRSAVVSPEASLAEDVRIGPHVVVECRASVGRGSRLHAGVYVGPEAVLGEDCLIAPHVVVGARCRLGNRVAVQPGAVIGSDGFGYVPVGGELRKIPQIGIVIVEDDVEIGANTCIDRATMGATRIGRGTKIDNLVQIAHNVAIAEQSILAAQVGIAGSTNLGRGVRLGGQAGLAGHIRIGDGASIGGQAGVTRDVSPGMTVSGYPARPHREALKAEAELRRLPELARRLRAIEKTRERESEG